MSTSIPNYVSIFFEGLQIMQWLACCKPFSVLWCGRPILSTRVNLLLIIAVIFQFLEWSFPPIIYIIIYDQIIYCHRHHGSLSRDRHGNKYSQQETFRCFYSLVTMIGDPWFYVFILLIIFCFYVNGLLNKSNYLSVISHCCLHDTLTHFFSLFNVGSVLQAVDQR